ncbi:MAG: FAD-dependent monooxygenase [Methyloligellaceae bacterium]
MNSSEIDHTQVDIAISGGSFAGLTLAYALSFSSSHNLQIAVIDPQQIDAPSDKFDGRAFAVSAGSKQLLEVLGIWSHIAEHAQPVSEIEITDTALEAVIRPALLHFNNNLQDESAATHILESTWLLNILREKVGNRDNIRLFSGNHITDFKNEQSSIHLFLQDKTEVRSRLLVAADGKKSELRKQAGIKTIGWPYDQMGIVTTITHSRSHEGKAVQHFLPNGPFAILPLTNNRSSLVWSEKTEIARQLLKADDETFLSELKLRAGRFLGEISLAGPRGGFPLDLQIAREFIADRFALIGDAAHGIHPIAGLGLNIGLRDVAALTEVIIKASRIGVDFGSQPILQQYSRWRRFDSTISAFTMDALNRLFSNEITPVKVLRDLGLGLVNRSQPLKSFFMNEAAGNSEGAPLLLQGQEI